MRPALELAQAQVQRAQLAGEGDLLVLVELLARKDEHGVRVHQLLDAPHLLRRQRLAQVDALDAGAQGLQRGDVPVHGHLTRA